ncbi:23S rRNA (adenine(2503)-C(2))-methyltransferase RlmN [candidate division KSB1 bacterium]|nr:23S rRNA (adenine(2503)-C(2))-methyltransferase RlmN [candidate division KSB1 bacterium]
MRSFDSSSDITATKKMSISGYSTKTYLKGLSLEQLQEYVQSLGMQPYRAKQLFHWMYRKNVSSFSAMTTLKKSVRESLEPSAEISLLKLSQKLSSSYEPTTKYLFELMDGKQVETVFMEVDDRKTICLSSQVGCALKCGFCATGLMGFIRNLSAGEIVDQVLMAERNMGQEATNIVMMGMGEPFLNYDSVIQAAYLISDPEGIAISKRKITISTSGIIPAILRFANEEHRFKLAISLNATTENMRRKLMPLTKKYSLDELLKAVKYYTDRSKSRVTFEYVLLENVNDSMDDALRLRKLLSNIPCKINLIPYNATELGYSPSSEDKIQHFISALASFPVPVTVRRSKGRDIFAACGQLYIEKFDG